MYHGVVKTNDANVVWCSKIHTKHESSLSRTLLGLSPALPRNHRRELKLETHKISGSTRAVFNTPGLLMERSNWTSSWACLRRCNSGRFLTCPAHIHYKHQNIVCLLILCISEYIHWVLLGCAEQTTCIVNNLITFKQNGSLYLISCPWTHIDMNRIYILWYKMI